MRNLPLSLIRLNALFLGLILASPGFSFDFPLTDSSIREAYFLGTRQGGISPDVLKQYSHGIDELHQGNCISKARIETPFLQIAEYVGSIPNYSAQDAVKELSGRPTKLRVFLDICFMREAPPPNSVKLKFI
ncbi:MAG TPA: hypothetical protein VFQ43_14415 [Nitrososphaera sp.]|nr:hypothetical protein [Nitrososphaera sp.]